jgi:two-component system chemotaxis response regulator CheY
MKILIVDDSIFIQKSIKKIISEKFSDASIFLASCGEDGLIIFNEQHPDIILTDLLMPGIGGAEFVRQVFEQDKTSKIIVISADVQKSILNELTEMGILAFINKPIVNEKAAQLLKLLEDCPYA